MNDKDKRIRITFERRINIAINKYGYLSLDGIVHSQYRLPLKINKLKPKNTTRTSIKFKQISL